MAMSDRRTFVKTKTVRWRPQTDKRCKRYQDRTVATSNGLRVPSFGGRRSFYCEFLLLEEAHTKALSNGLRVPFVKHNSFGGFFTIKMTDSSRYIYNSLRGTIKSLRRISTTTTRFIFLLCCNHTYKYDSTYR